ncbi:MAG: tRNA pseudouridine(55) synthase TruB [Acidiferrobacterales bacterium]|nr:tRNA pseudouridine(55) synthase TruB [Acidiferrobacterales bacterium]
MNVRHKEPAAVSGILLFDKPSAISSNAALKEVKSLLHVRKAGHTGNLDPIATGLLPICIGEATKAAGFFLDADKCYRTVVKFGESTTTGDREGDVIERRPVMLTKQKILRILDEFVGEYDQLPPMYSAVKINGEPLYKYARQGIEIQRKTRRVRVYRIKLLNLDDSKIEIELTCSSGYYVRVLAHQIGERLGCGAHVESLRRIGVGILHVNDSYSRDEIEQIESVEQRRELLIPCDQTLTHLPKVDLSSDAAYYLCRGQAVRAGNLPPEGVVRLYEDSVGFLGIGTSLGDGRVAPKRLFHHTNA